MESSAPPIQTEAVRPRERAERRDRRFFGRPRPPFPVRRGVQLLTVAVVLLVGFQFAHWVGNLEAGRIEGVRPGGVEGFLPISALISLRHLLVTGEFSPIHPAGLVIFSLAILTGLVVKKAFCSWICPVGTLAEYLARLSHKVFRRRLKLPTWLDYGLMSLKYLLLLFFVYSVFFEMTPHTVALFLDSPYNKVADIKMLHFFTKMSTLAAQVLAGLVVLSFVLPYFWCRYLCPYGALLGLLSLGSTLKVTRSPADCTDCGRCAEVCPAFLAVDHKQWVHSVECTGCLECVVNCPEERALSIQTPPWWRRTVTPVLFAVVVSGLFFGGIGLAKIAGRWQTGITQEEFLRRVQEIDHPKYHHARGQVPEYGPED